MAISTLIPPEPQPPQAQPRPRPRTQLFIWCCTCSLRTGVIVLAWLRLVCALVALVYFSYTAAGVERTVRAAVHKVALQDKELAGVSPGDLDRAVEDAVSSSAVVQGVRVVFILLAVMSAVDIPMAAVLLTGIYKESSRLLRFWVAVAIGTLTVRALLELSRAGLLFVSDDSSAGVGTLLGVVIGVGIGVFFIRIVRRFRQELVDPPPFVKMEI